ncbi:hypothetical protein HAV21_03535 [Paenarthrobacter sp. MSM-2-10-13]|uniref:hypothetical protein n=1 Tax=Paenarthrobacter sp. MSM-2-10-13 TaxID=2717318 RepID=UPI00141F16EB|nr:hypothetical protein [Paenarthrobacter sp. MSM-2-10-13]NHW45970.1 hypothetical protein [Paenarthrobacter sp. MSM-2-10-13]
MAKQPQDHKSNIEVAEAIVAPKRKYFLPIEGVTVEADDELEAAKKAKQQKEAEVGDDSI